jgi:hypothetical protein
MVAWLLVLALQEPPSDDWAWARAIDEADLSWWPGDEIGFELSGTHVWEVHAFGDEPPGLTVEDPSFRTPNHGKLHRRALDAADSVEFLHRTDLWLEGTLGPYVRLAAHGRFDRGPVSSGDSGWAGRLEQGWLEVGIAEISGRAGKFSAPVGNFLPRHDPRTNPLISFPLPYDQMTTLRHAGDTTGMILGRRDIPDRKDWRPILWREMYGYGAMLFGSGDAWEYAAALMTLAPSSWPEEWERRPFDFVDPNLYLRGAFKPDISTKIGASFATGGYQKGVDGLHGGDHPQTLVGLDFAWADGDWELYAEAFRSRWETPLTDDLVAWAYYVELRYQIQPGLYAAGRFGQIFFDEIRDAAGDRRSWDRDLTRLELGGGYFFTRNFWVKLMGQQNETSGGREPDDWLVSMQVGLSF